MKESPFLFFRSNPALFHWDFRDGAFRDSRLFPRPEPKILTLGDPHFGNFGSFKGPDGKAVWGLNDYDQVGITLRRSTRGNRVQPF